MNMSSFSSLPPSVAKASKGLLAIYVLNSTVNAVSIVMSIGLIVITVRNRRLHNTCSLLIGFCSLCTILLQFFIFIPFFIVLLPQIQSVRLIDCFFIQAIPVYGIFSVISLMGIIGVDRLLSVFFPLWYLHRNEKACFFVLIGLSAVFPLFILWIVFQNAVQSPDLATICTLGELLGQSTVLVAVLCLLFNFLSVICYLTVWAKLKWDIRKSMSQETINSRQPIFKSLAIILAIQVGGWFISEVAFGFIYSGQMDSIQQWLMAASVNCFVCMAAAADPIVLFTTSEEYRKAFCQQFPFLGRIWQKISSAGTTASNGGTNAAKFAWRKSNAVSSTMPPSSLIVSSNAQNYQI